MDTVNSNEIYDNSLKIYIKLDQLELPLSEVPFTVSARTALLIGQENFANADGAIIELVKNSYDADANMVLVIFDDADTDPSKHRIHIIDNGEGMTQELVVSKWMQIGTDNKKVDFTSSKGRIKTGAKGIGRFALDRLGERTTMITKSKDSEELIQWEMDWKQFEEPNKTISEIKARIVSDKANDLFSRIEQQLLTSGSQKLLGEDEKANIPDIGLTKKDFESGTIITISNLKDSWTERQLNTLYKGLEALIPPLDLEMFSVYMQSAKIPKELGQVSTAYFNDYDYRIEAEYNAENLQVKLKIERDEFDLVEVKKEHTDVFNGKKTPYDLDTLLGKSFEVERDIKQVLKWDTDRSDRLLKNVGDFKFVFYFLRRGPEPSAKYPQKEPNFGERRKTLERFGGVKIYRDSFRVRPYGEHGDDWLDLGSRQRASTKGAGQVVGAWRVGQNQIAGAISISRISNPNLIDKSDRSSLIDNEAFDTFKKIVVGIISEFEYDRSKIFNPFYKKWEQIRKEEEDAKLTAKATELAKKIVEEQNKEVNQKKKESRRGKEQERIKEELHSAFKEFVQGKDEDAELEEATLRGLASLGIIVSASSHELRALRNNILPDIEDLKNSILKNIPTEKLSKLSFREHPIKILEGIEDDQLKVKYWLNYAITGINRDKRTRKSLDFNNYFEGFEKAWQELLSLKNIVLELSPPPEGTCVIRAFEIDMDTIFNNLVSNSIDAFINQREIVDRKIKIKWSNQKDVIEIVYADNGPGLSEVFSHPEEIFVPFVSSKKDEYGNQAGTGLGMYLVNLVVQSYSGEINLNEKENGFALMIQIPIRKEKT